MTIDIYLDFEATGTNPYYNEAITAFLLTKPNNLGYNFCCAPVGWSSEAEKIHGISRVEAKSYPPKIEAFGKLIEWLPNDFRFITYVNKNTELGTINFDVALLENELNLLGYPFYFLKNEKGMKDPISVYDIAKECAKDGLFNYIKQKEAYKLGLSNKPEHKNSNRPARSQPALYYALFGSFYDSHRADSDVLALVKIHEELIRLQNANRDIFSRY